MIATRTFHLPVRLVAEQGHDSICPLCFIDLVIFAEPGGELLTCEFGERDPARDCDHARIFDKLGRPDGWVSLRLHTCPDLEISQ